VISERNFGVLNFQKKKKKFERISALASKVVKIKEE
jgi:hypothetical protein